MWAAEDLLRSIVTSETKIWIYCDECNRQNNHVVHCEKVVKSHPKEHYHWNITHYLAQCAGCESFCYAIYTLTEDDRFGVDEEDIEGKWETYPRAEGERKPMENVWQLPPMIRDVYTEVVASVNAQSTILSAIGLRALIESICREQKVQGGFLYELIDGLADNGVLSVKQATILHGHRFMGNIAAHEIKGAKREELLAASKIAETMLETIYILPLLSKKLPSYDK